MALVIIFTIFVCVLSFIAWCWLQRWKLRLVDKLPGPKTLPIIGNALELGDNPIDSLKAFMRFVKTYGPIYRVWIGQIKVLIFVSDPVFLEMFLSSPKYLTKSSDYHLFAPWLKNGLLLSTGSYWQKRRKIITPTFHFKILEQFIPVFNKQGEILVNKLLEETDENKNIDIHPYMTAYTLDVICETAMGTTVNAQQDPNNNYCRSVKELCHILMVRNFSPWKQFDVLFKYSSDYKEQEKALNVIHGFTKSVITERRQQLSESENKLEAKEDDIGSKKKIAFLDLLLQATSDGQPLNDEDICEEVDTFMFEGHDTTSSALSFAMYSIARNPDAQDKIFKELQNLHADDKNNQWTLQDLNNMKYIELVIKETLRLYPSVPYYGRTLEEDVHYKGMILPKGAMVTMIPISMHRNPELFKDPEKFLPERFLPENSEGKYPFAYVPFSAGPRNCIGQKFAMYELKATIAKICKNFILMPADSDSKYDIVLSGEAVLKSATGMHLKLKKRI